MLLLRARSKPRAAYGSSQIAFAIGETRIAYARYDALTHANRRQRVGTPVALAECERDASQQALRLGKYTASQREDTVAQDTTATTAELARLKAVLEERNKEIEALRARSQGKVSVKFNNTPTTDKKTNLAKPATFSFSVYGLGQFPVTLYASQWMRLVEVMPALVDTIARNIDKAGVKLESDRAEISAKIERLSPALDALAVA